MTMIDIIRKKRDGKVLFKEEIDFWIKGCVNGEIPDYQTSALLMAVFIRGLNKEETANLTDSMLYSGETVDLSSIEGIKVDKHSTGGVGDKTTLIVAPICAAAGLKVAKMSGRGLGFTGGTIDKLESIPGFRVELSMEEFKDNLKEYGLAVMSQTKELAPADKTLYALRDVTATVESMPLIASSIMSKKLAFGADIIVLDVKYGSGAFMKKLSDAEALAEEMIAIASSLGRKCAAHITAMNQPLGNNVGNALEVSEAIEVLKGGGPEDLKEVSLNLASEMIYQAELFPDREQAYQRAKSLLVEGKALEKFRALLMAQGGDTSIIDQDGLFKRSYLECMMTANADGYIYALDAEKVGYAALTLGAGRSVKEEKIDYGAGIVFKAKVGDKVRKGQEIAYLYGENTEKCLKSKAILEKAFIIKKEKPVHKDLVSEIVTKDKIIKMAKL